MLLRARILGLAATVPLLMRIPLPRLARVLEPRRTPAAPAATAEATAAAVEAVLGRSGRLVGANCLTRGVTRYWFLRRAGLDVALCFGLGHPDGAAAGHCWVLRDEEPYLEPVDPRPVFVETYRIPAR